MSNWFHVKSEWHKIFFLYFVDEWIDKIEINDKPLENIGQFATLSSWSLVSDSISNQILKISHPKILSNERCIIDNQISQICVECISGVSFTSVKIEEFLYYLDFTWNQLGQFTKISQNGPFWDYKSGWNRIHVKSEFFWIFLSLRFYVKSIMENIKVMKLPFLPF